MISISHSRMSNLKNARIWMHLLSFGSRIPTRSFRMTLVMALSGILVALVFFSFFSTIEAFSFAQDEMAEEQEIGQESEIRQNREIIQSEIPQFPNSQDPRTDSPLTAQGSVLEKNDDGRIEFSFDQQPWQNVIEFFADQLGFALQPISQPPEGTFTYFDNESHSVAEAMDILNHALLTQGFTLVRNKNMLILQQAGQINEALIETVTSEELYQRGNYEMLRCEFDLTGLEGMALEEQIRQLNKSGLGFYSFPAAGKMQVVENGSTLRQIDRILKETRENMLKVQQGIQVYQMQHVDPESLLIIVRQLMNFEGDSNVSLDGSITISVHPLGDKLYLKTTLQRFKEFLDIAKMVDVPPESSGGVNIEKPEVRTYEVLTAPTLAFQILQTNLEGREGVRMDQDEETGTIYVMGRQSDHEIVQGILDELKRNGPGNYAIINVVNADAEDILEKLQKFFRQDTDEGASSGPILFGDATTNQISVRGKPFEVELVKTMVAEMDAVDPTQLGPRTTVRIVSGDPSDISDFLPALSDMFEATGRKNRLNIVMPKDRSAFRSRNQIRIPSREQDRFVPNFDDYEEDVPKSDQGGGAWSVPGNSKTYYVSYPARQDQEEDVGKSSEETREPSDNYTPPEEPESVPGDPIEVKLISEGLKITSRDLDALDDMENLLRNRLKDSSSADAGPTIFPLQYRRVENVKPFLDRLFGLETGGGGGAGGLGGALGGMLGNAVGGGAGDLLSGMLGGGGDSTSAGGLELEGDVVIEMDIPFNALLVNNATENDLDAITDILFWLDQPQPPQNIDTVGENFLIPILYRSPVEVKEIVEAILGELIKGGSANNVNPAENQQAQQARAMQEMMRAVAGGGRGGGNAAKEEESPKASLAVDERRNALLVTGPRYIYEKILDVVELVDIPKPPVFYRVIPTGGKMSPQAIVDSLRPLLGDNLITEESDSTSLPTSSSTSRPMGETPNPQDAMRQQIQNAIMQGGGRVGVPNAPVIIRDGGNRGGGGGNRGGGRTPRGGGGNNRGNR